jgi:hypothetical protein
MVNFSKPIRPTSTPSKTSKKYSSLFLHSLMLNTISFGLIHCFHYSQGFQMKGIDTYFAYLEIQLIIFRDIKALTFRSHRQLLHMFGTRYLISILQFLLRFQLTFRCLVGLWMPQKNRHKHTFLYYSEKATTE